MTILRKKRSFGRLNDLMNFAMNNNILNCMPMFVMNPKIKIGCLVI